MRKRLPHPKGWGIIAFIDTNYTEPDMSRTPTPEQQLCITAVVSAIQMLQIRACAGSGKTSTLGMMAEALVVPSLYLAFNKVTATEASHKFPSHVTCRTTHSMAYAAFGAKLRDKLLRQTGAGGKYLNVAGTGTEIARYFHVESYENSEGIKVTANFIGLLVRDTVARFEQSADAEVQDSHIPTYELKQKLNDNTQSIAYVKSQVLKHAKKLWAERCDLKSIVLATHDTYLKLYQLSKPVFKGFDVVYVDEFQDTTPCVFDIIMNQQGHMKIVMVGDARQAIYGWRGAVNAMEMVTCATQYLSKSFRYGQAIADIATVVLERDMVITGNEKINSVAAQFDKVDRTKPYTRLFRTNSALLSAAVLDIAAGKEVTLEIDVRDFVKLLESSLALFRGDKKGVKHDKVLPYIDWAEFVEDGTKNDPELGRVAKVIKEDLAEDWIELLQSFRNSKTPHITYTTAHKSKGREWLQVIVESDFKSCYNEDGEWVGLQVEEQNLLYVAVTRAIEVLEYNKTTAEYLKDDRQHKNVDKVLKKMSKEHGMPYHTLLDDEYQYA